MRSTLVGAEQGVDVEELMSLYADGQPNALGFSDDPRFRRQLAWFEAVHSIEPRVWLYSYIVGKPEHNRRAGKPAVAPGVLESIYLVDLWANHNPAKASKFLESDVASSISRQVLQEGTLVEEPQIYTDKWGSWLSAFTPLHNKDGKIVAILGLDIDAAYVLQVQQTIRNQVLLAFIVTYSILFLLIYILSGVLTKHLTELTQSAKHIAAGNYNLSLSFAKQGQCTDEMNTLAQVFEAMINSIRVREQLIREGKQAEDEMRFALEKARELNELKSRFVSMVSHDFRTPLTVISTSTEILEHYSHRTTEEKKREYFKRIRVAIKNMTDLLEDILTIGAAEIGKLQFNPTQVNLEQFCQDTVVEIQSGVGGGYTIQFTSQGDCTNARLDKKLLRSILINLLSNAIKYSPSGSIVEFELSCLNQVANFKIRDQGIGIPLEDQPHLFELFHRAGNVDAIRGTGLGLAIVKQCVVVHQGQITFTSQEGVGTTFTVQLPLLT